MTSNEVSHLYLAESVGTVKLEHLFGVSYRESWPQCEPADIFERVIFQTQGWAQHIRYDLHSLIRGKHFAEEAW